MAGAYFYAHAPRSFFPAQNGGEAAILFCFISANSISTTKYTRSATISLGSLLEPLYHLLATVYYRFLLPLPQCGNGLGISFYMVSALVRPSRP